MKDLEKSYSMINFLETLAGFMNIKKPKTLKNSQKFHKITQNHINNKENSVKK